MQKTNKKTPNNPANISTTLLVGDSKIVLRPPFSKKPTSLDAGGIRRIK